MFQRINIKIYRFKPIRPWATHNCPPKIMKPTKCPAKEKKWVKKSKNRGEERKQKVKVKTAVSLLTQKLSWNFAFHVANILDLDQNVAKWMTCNWVYGKF